MHKTLVLFLLFAPGIINCQNCFRKQSQTAEDFAKQLIPANSIPCHKVIEGNFGNTSNGKNIVVFYNDTIKEASDVFGFVLLKIDSSTYLKVPIDDSIQPSMGYSSRILAVGFANADADNEMEIIVAIGQDIRLFDEEGYANGIGEFWFTNVYDSKPIERMGAPYLLPLFNFVGECFDISDTKKKLKELGF